MPWLIKTWKEISGGKPFAIKGIQSVHDAKKCVDIGCDGIVVSNHAGRQVDGAIASLDALDSIVQGMTYACNPIRKMTDLVQLSATRSTSCSTQVSEEQQMYSKLWLWEQNSSS